MTTPATLIPTNHRPLSLNYKVGIQRVLVDRELGPAALDRRLAALHASLESQVQIIAQLRALILRRRGGRKAVEQILQRTWIR